MDVVKLMFSNSYANNLKKGCTSSEFMHCCHLSVFIMYRILLLHLEKLHIRQNGFIATVSAKASFKPQSASAFIFWKVERPRKQCGQVIGPFSCQLDSL
ncbi:hypothetical protein VNO78_08007 [Psophocarpus tetragonolobus]|uniref:Uncharacterized protein n=1 Tax=Psophocarpus tetragonolobus TaxID=3891 RepID=A0AAN9T4A2_PSOTE